MVGIALVAVEAVTGSLVDIEDRRRVRRRPDRLDVRRRDARIVASVVIHHRTLGLFVEVARELAVIHHCSGDRQLAGREIR